jgi:hypothetical protein
LAVNLAFLFFLRLLRRPQAWVLAAIIAAGCSGNASATNLVTDGTFQQFVSGNSLSSSGGYICKSTGNSSCTSNLTDWISDCDTTCGTGATAASILIHGKGGTSFNCCGLWAFSDDPATTGNYIGIDGDRTYGAWIAQQVSGLVVGATYQITFDMAAGQQNGTTGATDEWWDVTFNATRGTGTVMSSSVISNPSHAFTGWNTIVMTLQATNSVEWLQFYANSHSSGLPPVVLLDNVSLVKVAPEPGTLALMLAAILGITAVRKNRTRKNRSTR